MTAEDADHRAAAGAPSAGRRVAWLRRSCRWCARRVLGRTAATSANRSPGDPGPRASQALMLAVRARALLDGRLAPSIDDVLDLAEPVLKHRMALTFSARAEGQTIPDVIKPAEVADRLNGERAGAQRTQEIEAVRRADGEKPFARGVAAASGAGSAPHRRHRDPRPAWRGAAPARARVSGNTAASSPASLRRASIGGVRRATIICMSASRNGKPRTPSGCGPTARRRWRSPPRRARDSKLERALVVTFALAELLVRRRRTRRRSRPDESDRAAATSSTRWRRRCCTTRANAPSLPPTFVPSALSEVVVLSDFWSPIAGDPAHAGAACRRPGAHGTLRAGRRSRRGNVSLFWPRRIRRTRGRRQSSPPAAPRPGREDYVARVAAHRAAIRAETNQARLAVLDAHAPTARPPNCCCSCSGGDDGRQRRRQPHRVQRGAPHDGRSPALLCPTAGCCSAW